MEIGEVSNTKKNFGTKGHIFLINILKFSSYIELFELKIIKMNLHAKKEWISDKKRKQHSTPMWFIMYS